MGLRDKHQIEIIKESLRPVPQENIVMSCTYIKTIQFLLEVG